MSDLYEVEKIVDKRKRFGKNEYKVKWLGYKMSECTWEPLEHLLNVMDEVEKYEKSIKKGKINLENNKIEKKIKNTNEEEKANVYYIDNRYKKVITITSINQNLYGIVQFENNGIIHEKKNFNF